jgi:transposase
MPKAREVVLTPGQERELIWTRDHHQKAYMRTKAAAILKVAAHGLLKPVKQDVVSDWIDRYESEGLSGLLVRKGRGRKPAFSPCGGPARA